MIYTVDYEDYEKPLFFLKLFQFKAIGCVFNSSSRELESLEHHTICRAVVRKNVSSQIKR